MLCILNTKHVETEPNCLHELATYLKYYMALIHSISYT